MRKVLTVVGVVLIVASFYLGTRWIGIEYDIFRADSDRSMAELRRSLDESEGRINSIGTGLSEAVSLASQATDRSKRIEILIEAIDRAIKAIRERTE